ncbi:MAG: molybdopterin cofactor-binding domain-containing protein [Holophagaceae bacterium]
MSAFLDRRAFIQALGGGLAILVSLRPGALRAQDRRRMYPEDLNAYLHVGADGRVTVFTGKIEMGQGVMTSQAQMVAEELGVALASIDMVMGDTDRCPFDAGTWGSLTTRMFGPALRAAAAEARAALTAMAAQSLGVAKDRLVLSEGVFSVAGDPSQTVTMGSLAQGRKLTRVVGEAAVLRKAADFKVMGRSPRRLDGLEKVTGAAKFAGDLRLPDMVYARILRPPAHGAKLKTLDASAAERMAGVKALRDGDLVAVLAADPEACAQALDALKATWTPQRRSEDPDTIFDHLRRAAPTAQGADGGPAKGASARKVSSTFTKGYVAHAPMEPHTALADVKGGKATVWASTQTPFGTRERVARALGLETKDVRVITPYVGGGFGGKSADPQAVEAARLSKLAGRPVMLAWTRAEEFFHDAFDPAAVVTIEAGLDAKGRIASWESHIHAAGGRGAEIFYDVPGARVLTHGGIFEGRNNATPLHPFAVGPWRAPGANMNVFARESQMDLLAKAAGQDPLAFRLAHLKEGRMKRVLQAAAEAFGWKPRSAGRPAGVGWGIACGEDAGTVVATMAEVKVDRATGKVTPVRMVCAQEMGLVVNPTGAKMQMEGCLLQGLGYALMEELRFKGGEILDRNFDTYPLPRFSHVPKLETVIVENPGLAPQGGGEPAIITVGAVLANAVADACGARLYRLPMTPARVKAALSTPKASPKKDSA